MWGFLLGFSLGTLMLLCVFERSVNYRYVHMCLCVRVCVCTCAVVDCGMFPILHCRINL